MNKTISKFRKFCIEVILAAIGGLCGFLLGRPVIVPSYLACVVGLSAFLIGLLLPNRLKQEIRRKARRYFLILVGSGIALYLIFSFFLSARPEGALARRLNGDFEILMIRIANPLQIPKSAYIELIGIDLNGRLISIDKIELKHHPRYFPYYIKKSDKDLFNKLNSMQLRLYEKPSEPKREGELISVKGVWTYYGLKSEDIGILNNGYQINF